MAILPLPFFSFFSFRLTSDFLLSADMKTFPGGHHSKINNIEKLEWKMTQMTTNYSTTTRDKDTSGIISYQLWISDR